MEHNKKTKITDESQFVADDSERLFQILKNLNQAYVTGLSLALKSKYYPKSVK